MYAPSRLSSAFASSRPFGSSTGGPTQTPASPTRTRLSASAPVLGADVEVQVGELRPRPVADALGRDPLARDGGRDAPVPRHQLEALPDQHLRRDAADGREGEQTALLDVGDGEADLVDVTHQREGRRTLRGAHARERRAHGVRSHVGELRRGVAPDSRGLFLVARRPRRVQQCCQQFRGRHGLRIEPGWPTLLPDDLPDPHTVFHKLVGLAPRAGREPARVDGRATARTARPDDPQGSFCVSTMTTTELDTDLLTPLAAYLRLRETGRASLPARVASTRGGSGATRSSAAATGSSRSRRPSSSASPSSATSATTTSRSSSGRCRCRRTGPVSPESRFVVADVFLRFDHVTGTAEVLVGDAAEVAARARAPRRAARGARRRGRDVALPGPAPSTSGASRWRRSTSAAATSSRSCCRSAPCARRASRRSPSTARCAASTRRRTSSCSSSTASRSSALRPRRT